MRAPIWEYFFPKLAAFFIDNKESFVNLSNPFLVPFAKIKNKREISQFKVFQNFISVDILPLWGCQRLKTTWQPSKRSGEPGRLLKAPVLGVAAFVAASNPDLLCSHLENCCCSAYPCLLTWRERSDY